MGNECWVPFMEDQNNQNPGLQKYLTVRNLTLLLMTGVVALAVFFQRSKTIPEQAIQQMEKRVATFSLKVVRAQVLFAKETDASEAQFEDLKRQINQILPMTQGKSPVLADIKKYILLEYLDSEAEFPLYESLPDQEAQELYAQLKGLYQNHRSLDSSAKLFELPISGDLARLKQYQRTGEEEKEKALHTRLKEEANQVIAMLFLFTGMIFLLGILSAAVIALFVYLKPERKFINLMKSLPEKSHSPMLDSFVIYLFLMVPVALVLQSRFSLFQSFFDHAMYLLGVFLVSIAIYMASAGGKTFVRLLHDGPFHPLKEVAYGFIGFVGIFPVAVFVVVLTGFFAGQEGSGVRFAHPIVFELEKNPYQILVFAALMVPVMEEIMFRVFLYGYLRKTMALRFSGLISGSIFAILHPQGWVALPYLVILGFGLSILREYRPGVIAPIVTHMIINGLAIAGNLLLLRM